VLIGYIATGKHFCGKRAGAILFPIYLPRRRGEANKIGDSIYWQSNFKMQKGEVKNQTRKSITRKEEENNGKRLVEDKKTIITR